MYVSMCKFYINWVTVVVLVMVSGMAGYTRLGCVCM